MKLDGEDLFHSAGTAMYYLQNLVTKASTKLKSFNVYKLYVYCRHTCKSCHYFSDSLIAHIKKVYRA